MKFIKFSKAGTCPECGSSNTWETIDAEGCNNCGWGIRYN